MAYIPTTGTVKPVVINKFLGYHKNNASTQLALGESDNMTNFYIINGYKLAKIEGYEQEFATLSHPIRGQWHGRVGNSKYHLFACNGHIYNKTTGGNVDLGTLTDDVTNFFGFGDKVYIVNGHEYKVWNGTGTITDVQGYRPLVYMSVNPDGKMASGESYQNISEYEPSNLLTGQKRIKFNTLATGSIVFTLPEKNLTSVDFCKVLGNTVTPTATDLINGTVTLTISTGQIGEDFVEIGWTKGTGSRAEVLNNKYVRLWGETNDTRVFMFGNTDARNRIVYSGLADSLPSAEYFPANGHLDVGVSNNAVLDFTRHQTRFVVNKEDGIYIGDYELMQDTTGTYIVTFPTKPLTDVQTKPYGQVRICNGYPIFIGESIRKLISTDIQSERDTPIISQRIQPDLDEVDLSTAITVDYENRWEYWLCVGKTVWIYNYLLDVYSKLELAHTPTCFIVINRELYFGTDDGYIMKFHKDYETFNGTTIDAHWEMGFYDFGATHLNKSMTGLWVSMLPEKKASVIVGYVIGSGKGATTQEIKYNIFSFRNFSFSDLTFNTSYNPRPFNIKPKPKQFAYYKLTLDNNSPTDGATILEIVMQVEYGGEVK